MNTSPDRSLARDIGLLLTLMMFFNGLLVFDWRSFPHVISATDWMGIFYTTLFVHICFTLYDGRFDRLRTLTWTLLICVWLAAGIFSEISLLTHQAGLAAITESFWFRPVLPMVALALDIAVMHRGQWWTSALWRIAALLALAVLGAIAPGLMLSAFVSHPAPLPVPLDINPLDVPPNILPPWQALPFYAIARAIPGKLVGIVTMLAAMLLPLMWPWMRTDLLRRSSLWWLWAVLCVGFAAVWIALGYCGSRNLSDAEIIPLSRMLTAYYVAFLTVLPLLLRSAVRREYS